MVQGAVHDALNAITAGYAAYYFEGPRTRRLARGRVAAAAHTVLVGVIELRHARSEGRSRSPSSRTPTRRRWPGVRDGPARTQGRRGRPRGRGGHAGAPQGRRRHAGRAVYAGHGPRQVAAASEPRSRPTRRSRIRSWPRLWLPSTLPGWGNVTPFTLLSASQFWLPGPPALTSEAYARDFNEVKNLGGQVSTARTPEQTEIARFWFEGPPAWNTHRPGSGRSARPRCLGQRPAAGPHEPGDGGRLHRRLQDPLRVRLLAPGHRHPRGRHRRQRRHGRATRPGTACRTRRRSPTIPRPRAPSAGRRRRSSPARWAPTRSLSRSRAGRPSTESRARSRASRRRRAKAPTPGSMPASTSARRARTGSRSGARSASGWRSTFSR